MSREEDEDKDIAKMNNDQEQLPDDIEVLRSIYPEIEIESSTLSLKVKLEPEQKVKVCLMSENVPKVLKSFETTSFEPLKFTSNIPMDIGSFELESSWLSQDVLSNIITRLHIIIQYAKDGDELDTLMYGVLSYLTAELYHDHYDSIFPSEGIITSSKDQYDLLQKNSDMMRQENFKEKTFDCSICLETASGDNGVLLECDHAFCKACFTEYATQMINSDDPSKLQCPNCPIDLMKGMQNMSLPDLKSKLFKIKMDPESLLQIFDSKIVKQYELSREMILFEKFQQCYPFSCSKCPRCSRWGFRDDVDDKLVVCQHCRLAYCSDCFHSWHGTTNYCKAKLNTIPLHVIEKMLDEDVGTRDKEVLLQKYGRRSLKLAVNEHVSDMLFKEAVDNDDSLVSCPKCAAVVTKLDGCNRMRCKVCSTHFCYLCGLELDDVNPYTHFTNLKSGCYGKLFEGMPGMEDD